MPSGQVRPSRGIFRSSAENEYPSAFQHVQGTAGERRTGHRKTTKTSSGASVFTLRKNGRVVSVRLYGKDGPRLVKEAKYRKATLPSAGTLFEDDDPELTQQTLL